MTEKRKTTYLRELHCRAVMSFDVENCSAPPAIAHADSAAASILVANMVQTMLAETTPCRTAENEDA